MATPKVQFFTASRLLSRAAFVFVLFSGLCFALYVGTHAGSLRSNRFNLDASNIVMWKDADDGVSIILTEMGRYALSDFTRKNFNKKIQIAVEGVVVSSPVVHVVMEDGLFFATDQKLHAQIVSLLPKEKEGLIYRQKTIDDAYHAVLNRLSAEGKKDFLRGQNEWVTFVKEYCNPKTLHWRYKTADYCLVDKYEARAKELENAIVTTKEGLVIRRAEHFVTQVVDISDDPDGPHGEIKYWPSEVDEAWPQIDNPSTEGQRQWNAFMAEGKPSAKGGCDFSSGYKISLTGPDFISTEMQEGFYCHGAAHGNGSSKNISRILSANRDIEASDIFKADSDWAGFVQKTAIANLKIQEPEAHYPQVAEYSADLKHWSFSEGGLEINYGELRGYAYGPCIAKISWKDLNPYLQGKLPFGVSR